AGATPRRARIRRGCGCSATRASGSAESCGPSGPRTKKMLTASNITMQFGAKPLFENISVRFGEGNRYGLIGANGSGKSTLMQILGGDLEPSAGQVVLDPGVRLGKLRQDQFAYEDKRVLDVVMMGHVEMWEAMSERDA